MKQMKFSHPVWIAAVVLMITGALFIAGCSSNTPSGGTGPAGQGSPETTAPATTVTTVTVTYTIPPEPVVTLNRPAAGSVKAVDYTRLVPFLPAAPAGWTAAEPEGSDISEQDASWSMASRTYAGSAGQTADVSIIDSAYYDVSAWTGWTVLVNETTADGYTKSGTTAGFPSWESYDKGSSSYDTWVGLDNRYLVTVSITNGSKADLDSFVSSVSYAGIAALK